MSRTSTSSRSASALPSRAFHSASASFSAAWCSRLVRIGRSSILATSNRSGIDSVVLAMRADEPDEHHAPVVVHRYDETIVVALDVENHAVVRDEARVPVRGLDIGGRAPIGAAGQRVPGAQRDFGVAMRLPEIPQRAQRDDPHGRLLYHAPMAGARSALTGR